MSGMIRGIGPVYARKLVSAFGDRVFDVIESEPDRLQRVSGIGPVRAERIVAAWAEQKVVREIMVFLHSHGVGTARAVRIFKTYGADAVQVMSENPYRLARDIRGIGFKTADAIAMRLGITKTATIRVRAGISYALTEAMDDGHCGGKRGVGHRPQATAPILDSTTTSLAAMQQYTRNWGHS
jgi:exodeoxyribonuclease V alpha subunit